MPADCLKSDLNSLMDNTVMAVESSVNENKVCAMNLQSQDSKHLKVAEVSAKHGFVAGVR